MLLIKSNRCENKPEKWNKYKKCCSNCRRASSSNQRSIFWHDD